MTRRPLGVSLPEVDRQVELEELGIQDNPNRRGYSPRIALWCLQRAAAKMNLSSFRGPIPDLPGEEYRRLRVLRAFLIPELRAKGSTIPSVARVAAHLKMPTRQIRADFNWLRDIGATEPFHGGWPKHLRSRQKQGSWAGEVLLRRAGVDGSPDDLSDDELERALRRQHRLQRQATRRCLGCGEVMLDKRHKTDLLGFRKDAKVCSPMCEKRAARSKKG